METLAQSAAKMAILSTVENFEKACKDPSSSLDELEKRLLDRDMPLIESLVRDHGLKEKLVSKYRKKMFFDVYNGAGSRLEFVWQAAFAKKHQL